ncbi:uncharacterized protein [Musca autumnalis]|uniref:uncharacterized protein n=1 Tax=Musca autumnalis TaxID=221902 RepID=UPI003CEFA3B6
MSARKSNSSINNNKTLRFDEENLRATNHPMEKDYGLMSIPESKTPFPRHADPVEAKELQKRLQEVLERANRTLMLSQDNNTDPLPNTTAAEYNGEHASIDEEQREKQHIEFLRKRKQFYQSEFLIAKQKIMSKEIHPPGPSVGNNWRIDDNGHNLHGGTHVPSAHTTNSSIGGGRIASTISRHCLPNLPESHLNQNTLREIAELMNRHSSLRRN